MMARPDPLMTELKVAHWPKAAASPVAPAGRSQQLAGRGLFVDTCLRQVHISCAAEAALEAADEHYRGAAAYRFLLELATGLRSAIAGETNVLGQLKSAWLSWRDAACAEVVRPLVPVMHRLFHDARVIRRDHLQGIGGISYGSLARRLIAPADGDKILFVGAGQMSRSMLPLFRGYAVGVWTRDPLGTRLTNLARQFASGEGPGAARWADHIVLATPADLVNDDRWQTWIGGTTVQSVLHLGHRGTGRDWPGAERAYDLQDLFALRQDQGARRARRLASAREACAQRARQFAPASLATALD